MRLIDQVRLLGKTGYRTENPKKAIIRNELYCTPHLNKPLSSLKEEWAPEIEQSSAMLSSLYAIRRRRMGCSPPSLDTEIPS